MPHPFPHSYRVGISKTDKSIATVSDQAGITILGAPPVEFGGPSGYWSPETLLMASIGLCFLTTLESLVAKEKIEIAAFTSTASGTLDKTKEGLVFTKIELQVEIRVDPTQIERVRMLVQKAEKYCLISNALKPSVVVSAQVLA